MRCGGDTQACLSAGYRFSVGDLDMSLIRVAYGFPDGKSSNQGWLPASDMLCVKWTKVAMPPCKRGDVARLRGR